MDDLSDYALLVAEVMSSRCCDLWQRTKRYRHPGQYQILQKLCDSTSISVFTGFEHNPIICFAILLILGHIYNVSHMEVVYYNKGASYIST